MKKAFLLKGVMVFLFCLATVGCLKNQERQEKEILKYDPSFEEIIKQRNAIKKELAGQQAALVKNKEKINAKVDVLKQKKVEIGREYTVQVQNIRNRIEPQKRKLKLDLVNTESQYRKTDRAVRSVDKDIKEISALIEKKESLALTQEELQTWKDRRATLIEDKQKLSSERAKLQEEVRIIRMKLRVLVL